MADSFDDARKRQLARLDGTRPPTARAALALAKSQAYQDAADAPATLRAYAADLANYKAWSEKHGFAPMPATPEVCQESGVAFTRCRPYRKNDQAWVEQKNGAVVRRMVGYRRFEGLEVAAE